MLSSRGEVKIHEILEEAGLRFEEEKEFPGLVASSGRALRFDFCVYDDDGEIDFLIEYNGVQHYKPKSKFGGKAGLYKQRFNDIQKRKFCIEHGLKLIEIPYTEESLINYDYIMTKAGY